MSTPRYTFTNSTNGLTDPRSTGRASKPAGASGHNDSRSTGAGLKMKPGEIHGLGATRTVGFR